MFIICNYLKEREDRYLNINIDLINKAISFYLLDQNVDAFPKEEKEYEKALELFSQVSEMRISYGETTQILSSDLWYLDFYLKEFHPN